MNSHDEDIRKEIIIQKKWNIKPSDPSRHPQGILVTGPNSFIGTHVIHMLQKQWDGTVHILIRSSSEKEAIHKMQQAFLNWHLGTFQQDKIIFHLGDVSQNRMGLAPKEYTQMKEETGTVLHLAMTPLYHLPYHHFKRMWVPELDRMIAFCGDPRFPKSLHYASSFNANFFESNEDFMALNTNAWQSGYAGFKWVACQALKNVLDQGLNGCVYDIPLVLGSEKNGICPIHYSIWMILDIFLKTGYFFKFNFRIIPVDILAEVMVFNMIKEKENQGTAFVRPLLSEPVTDRMFSRIAAGILGLREGNLETVREACQNKLRFDFMMPEDFYGMIDRVNNLPAVYPQGYDTGHLPITPMVFMSNLNRVLAQQKETMGAQGLEH